MSDRLQALDMQSSGAWAEHLADEYLSLALYQLEYIVILKGGALLWSRVTALHHKGMLLGPSCRVPLSERELAARRQAQRLVQPFGSLHAGNPFLQRGQPLGRGGRGRSSKASNQGAGRRGRGRQAESMQEGQGHNPEASARLDLGVPLDDEVVRIAPNVAGDSADGDADLGDEIDVFDFEAELQGLLDVDLGELVETFAEPGLASAAKGDSESNENVAPASLLESLSMAAEEEAAETGLASEGLGHQPPAEEMPAPSGTTASSSTSPSMPEPAAEPQAVAPDTSMLTGPTEMGYVYQEGRVIMRVQRGKPKNSLSVKCYKHSQCTFLLSLRCAPSDEELLQWSVAVPAPPPGASQHRRRIRHSARFGSACKGIYRTGLGNKLVCG